MVSSYFIRIRITIMPIYDTWWKVVFPFEIFVLLQFIGDYIVKLINMLYLRYPVLILLFVAKYAIWISTISVSSFFIILILRWIGTMGMSSLAILVRLSYMLTVSHNTPTKMFSFFSPPPDEVLESMCTNPYQLWCNLFPHCCQ